jgi:hypothetical protein
LWLGESEKKNDVVQDERMKEQGFDEECRLLYEEK